jgi:hypothetical protein
VNVKATFYFLLYYFLTFSTLYTATIAMPPLCGTPITENGGARVFCVQPLGHAGLCDHSKPIKRRLSAGLAELQMREHCDTSTPGKSAAAKTQAAAIAKPETPVRDAEASSVERLSAELRAIRDAVKSGALKSAEKSKSGKKKAAAAAEAATKSLNSCKPALVCGTPTVAENGMADFCRQSKGHLGECFPELLPRKRQRCASRWH